MRGGKSRVPLACGARIAYPSGSDSKGTTNMALGATLKSAREAKGLTIAELANELHLKMQIVEDLENEDFQHITASIYGRGFLKLLAERLEIDPAPMLEEFKQTYQKPSHETAPYGTPEYRRQEELAKARAAANEPSTPPRRPIPIVPAEPVDIQPRVIAPGEAAAPASVTVSPAVPVEPAEAAAPAASAEPAPAPAPVAAPAPSPAAPAPAAPAVEAEDSLFRRPAPAAPASPAAPAPSPAGSAEAENLLFTMAAPQGATMSVDASGPDRRPRTGVFVPPARTFPIVEPAKEPAPKPEKPKRVGPGPLRRAWTAFRAGAGRLFAAIGRGAGALGAFFARNARTVSLGIASLLMALLAVWAVFGIRSAIHAHRERSLAARPKPAAVQTAAKTGAPAVWSEMILPPPVLFAE